MTQPILSSEAEPHDLSPSEFEGRGRIALLRNVRRRVTLLLSAVADTLDRRPILSFGLLMFLIVPCILGDSLDRPLSHDELFTFYISQAPSVSAVLRDIQLVDLNPPLSYFLTRTSFTIFGVNTLSCRLPEIGGFLLAMVSIFFFVRNRVGTLYGVLAAALLYTGHAGEISSDARPYGLLLGFGSLSLLAWQKSRRRDPWCIPLLSIGAFGMLLSHVFGIFVWFGLAGAEAIRVVKRRRCEWPVVVAWMLPVLSVVLYLPLVKTHAGGIFPVALQATRGDIFDFYNSRTNHELAYLLLTVLLMRVLAGHRIIQDADNWLLPVADWVSVIPFIGMPAALLVFLIYTHAAWFLRYGALGCIGISIVMVILLAKWCNRDSRAALMCIYIALVSSGKPRWAVESLVYQHVLTSTEPRIERCEACTFNPSLPLIDASGLTFLEMDHREDTATLRHIFYLTDTFASTRYSHANIFEGMALEHSLFPMRASVTTYSEFLGDHHHFYVLGQYDDPEEWLLHKLQADGASLRMLGPTKGSYKDHDLYEITFQSAKLFTMSLEPTKFTP